VLPLATPRRFSRLTLRTEPRRASGQSRADGSSAWLGGLLFEQRTIHYTAAAVGLMFGLSRNTFVGSYLFFRVTNLS
jgi:hypothetical protein